MSQPTMWVEKYRPQTLTAIEGQTEIVSRMKSFVAEKNVPHLLLVGPAGIGKTTSILALAKDLYGTTWRRYVLELNASDERGINVVREKVKDFARTMSLGSQVPFKILIMDEADHLTGDAQHALRRTMEQYTKSCRFALLGNYAENIIDPIQSRCSVLRFTPLDETLIIGRLRYIAGQENVDVSEEGYKVLYVESNGDMRKAINLLQSAAATGETVTDTLVLKALARVSPERVKAMMNKALDGDFIEARSILRTLLINEGAAPEDIVKMFYTELMITPKVSEPHRIIVSELLGEVDYRLTLGARAEIQLSVLLSKLSKGE